MEKGGEGKFGTGKSTGSNAVTNTESDRSTDSGSDGNAGWFADTGDISTGRFTDAGNIQTDGDADSGSSSAGGKTGDTAFQAFPNGKGNGCVHTICEK